MLNYYIDYIKKRLKPIHLAKLELTVILFCILTVTIGPPPAPRLHEVLDAIHASKPKSGHPVKITADQIPPPELPYFAKE
ncbi:hypothetical protein [Pseudomonas aeruginosa]|uniref:hypothetical protein n=1 Tax=Pseudomonas aeruginosa TaxID=287 RepID=UPI000F840F59|nr:hypothetical protein [Pseudomonas aeruginosa]RTT49348.1 hypothetical protein DY958_11765 [Pseudomonas aeruginosa]